MNADPNATNDNRPLTDAERHLARWMLEHGKPEGKSFLPQIEIAEVTSWRCPCGCASINFKIKGHPPAPPGVHHLGQFVFGNEDDPNGIFIFESAGILSGIEVYGMVGEAPTSLPHPDSLRPFPSQGNN